MATPDMSYLTALFDLSSGPVSLSRVILRCANHLRAAEVAVLPYQEDDDSETVVVVFDDAETCAVMVNFDYVADVPPARGLDLRVEDWMGFDSPQGLKMDVFVKTS